MPPTEASTVDRLLLVISAIAGAVAGAAIAAVMTRWSLKRADDLARHRERQRDDRQHFRGLLLARFEQQQRAVRAYARLMNSGAEAIIKNHDTQVRELVLAAFESEDLANEAVAAATKVLEHASTATILERREAKAYLGAMAELLRKTRDQVQPPAVEDWHPAYQHALALADKEVADLIRDLGLDDAADTSAGPESSDPRE